MMRHVLFNRFGLLSLPFPEAHHYSVKAIGFGRQVLPPWALGDIFVR